MEHLALRWNIFIKKKVWPTQDKSEDKSEKKGINTKNGDIINYRNKYRKKNIHPAASERHKLQILLRYPLTWITHSTNIYWAQLSAVAEVLRLKASEIVWAFTIAGKITTIQSWMSRTIEKYTAHVAMLWGVWLGRFRSVGGIGLEPWGNKGFW